MNNRTRTTGFTLIEMLAVMAIIGILAGLILGVSSYASRKASESKAIAEMEKIKNGYEYYKIDFGVYPDYMVKISKYVSDLTYTNNGALDPWGNPYETNVSSFSVTIISGGQDGIVGGDHAADDIDSGKAQ